MHYRQYTFKTGRRTIRKWAPVGSYHVNQRVRIGNNFYRVENISKRSVPPTQLPPEHDDYLDPRTLTEEQLAEMEEVSVRPQPKAAEDIVEVVDAPQETPDGGTVDAQS